MFYFIDLANQLVQTWKRINSVTKSLTCKAHELEGVFSWLEDSNETLEYIADLLLVEELDERVKDTIMLSLLNFAYLPCLVNSLVVLRSPKKKTQQDEYLTFNTALHILL